MESLGVSVKNLARWRKSVINEQKLTAGGGSLHCPKYLATFRDIEGNVTAKKLYT